VQSGFTLLFKHLGPLTSEAGLVLCAAVMTDLQVAKGLALVDIVQMLHL
jgi:hypothetical protein